MGYFVHRQQRNIHQVGRHINDRYDEGAKEKAQADILCRILNFTRNKVTLFQASLLNTEPTMEAAIPPKGLPRLYP